MEKESVSEIETKRPRGRPRKPAHLKHPRSKDLSKCGPDGRVLPQYRKLPKIAGRRHHAAKRATRRRKDKREYEKRRVSQAAWRATLRRRYSQSRSYQRLTAQRKGLNPDAVWQLTYAEYLLIWETSPAVWTGEGFVPAKSLIGNPLVSKLNTYLDRLDRTKPFTRDNCRVFRGGKPLA